MIRFVMLSIAGFVVLSCAHQEIFAVPTAVPTPRGWHPYSGSMLGNSECPRISGIYVEPPDRYSTHGSQFKSIEYSRFGYLVVLPSYLSVKSKLTRSTARISEGEFELLQVNEERFMLRDMDLNQEITEYVFDQVEGDFRCRNGLMYFPLISRYGADQQGSFNDQHQRILAIDVKGNLVLIRISGPFKKTLFHRKADFEYDFMRYNKVYE